jgi:hypothetical protein
MSTESKLIDLLQTRAKKLQDRRQFFRKSSAVGAGVVGGMILSACGGGGDDAGPRPALAGRPTWKS